MIHQPFRLHSPYNGTMQVVTLTTDFGLRDGYAGVMKGVIMSRAPGTAVVDLTHDISPGDVRTAAFVLMSSFPYFPSGTVHMAVVDPGVGSSRAAVAIKARGHYFVGPDNGVLSWAVGERPDAAVEIRNPALRLSPVSRTFHGRDIFAPAAAALAAGMPLNRLGPRRKEIKAIPFPKVKWGRGETRGEVLATDRFGNAVTNIFERGARARLGTRRLAARVGDRRMPVLEAYSSARPRSPLGIFGSSGFLEISVRDASAAEELGLAPGSRVILSGKGRP